MSSLGSEFGWDWEGKREVQRCALLYAYVYRMGRRRIPRKEYREDSTAGSPELYLVEGAFLSPAPSELSVRYSYLFSSLCEYQEDGGEHSVLKLLEKLWKVPYTFSSTAEPDDLPVFLQESFLCLK